MSAPRKIPILFTTAMIREILAGTKRRTRRVEKLGDEWAPVEWPCKPPETCPRCGSSSGRSCQPPADGEVHVHHENDFNWDNLACPYGEPGDLLVVKQTFALHNVADDLSPLEAIEAGYHSRGLWLKTDPEESWSPGRGRWRPSIHMPLALSRLTLRRVDQARLVRAMDISWFDIRAEGVRCPEHDFPGGFCASECPALRQAWRELWDAINGPRGYGAAVDPWVWDFAFEVADGR